MRLKVKDSNLFLMPGNPHMLHLGTIGYGLREFVVFVCLKNPPLSQTNYVGKCYIEEAVLESKDFSKDVFAHLRFIEDDSMAYDLAKFAEEKGLLDVPTHLNKILTYPNYRPVLAQITEMGSPLVSQFTK